ncbi:leucine zipper protein 1 isoform X2 [Narcine bancroftii]|uniref:leucine zipper protein 1 isoform X2 n=1 Tax=Narcine bancroftii TaxID=1343680 RepID=UPI0038316B0F
MTDMMSLKETSSRQLRLKLSSLGRRVDELEEATRSLHRMEDEIMDLQDKVIQAEGSNSSLLSDVDVLRRRVLAIEGKDEEVRKAEDMCRHLKEKLEAEVKLSKSLKEEIEKLQDRMADLEKLEEAFNRSKSDCTQLGLSLNEEKNLSRKLTSELELLRSRVKELEFSEHRLDKSEKSIILELEKLKSLTIMLAEERKAMSETLQENEQAIQDLTMKLEMNNRINAADQSKNSSNLRANVIEKTYGYTGDRSDLRIEETMSTSLSSKGSLGKRGLDSLTIAHNVGLGNRDTQGGQEDNKIKDLTQEIERLKKRLTFLEMVEEDLKKTEAKHNELQEKFLNEQSLAKLLGDQIEEMKQQMSRDKALGNGETTQQEIRIRSRQDKPKYRGVATESQVLKEKSQEVSSQPRSQREKMRNRDLLIDDDIVGKSYRRPLSPGANRRFQRASSNPRVTTAGEKKWEEKASMLGAEQKDQDLMPEKVKKTREPPSVLSRYPPAANDPNAKRPWGSHSKPSINGPKSKADKDNGDLEQATLSDRQKKPLNCSEMSANEKPTVEDEVNDCGEDPVSTSPALLNGMVATYTNQSPSLTPCSESQSSYVAEFEVPLARDMPATERMPTRPHRSRYLHSSRSQDLGLEYTAVKCCPEQESPKFKHGEPSASHNISVSSKSGLELKRVCSPREGLRSKAIIKPAIIAVDKKEVMTAGVEPTAGEHRLSPQTMPNKVTSSITILPSELSSQRGGTREKHTSISNITLGSGEPSVQRNVPYEISVRRSDITMRPLESGSSEEDEAELGSGRAAAASPELADGSCGMRESSPEYAGGDDGLVPSRPGRIHPASREEVPERAAWRHNPSETPAHPAKRNSDLGLDFSRLAPRRTHRQSGWAEGAERCGGGAGVASEGYTRRLSGYSSSLDMGEPRRSSASDPGRSYIGLTETAARRKQLTSVASKVADWNSSCSPTGKDISEVSSALNSSLMAKRKEMAKQILSDIVTERVPKADTAGKRQSVKLELRRNAESSPTHHSIARTEDRTPVGILSQIRMTSRR